MLTLPVHILLFCVSFALVWVGGGLVVSSVVKLAQQWKLPAFVVSFFILGLLTSLPELTIGLSAIASNDPTIFVGNLLGGTIVIFFAIIPLLGIVGNGVKIPKSLDRNEVIFTLIVCIAPAFLIIDQHLSPAEGVLFILLYGILLLFVSEKASLMEKMKVSLLQKRKNGWKELVKICVGVGFLLIASRQIVSSTLFFADAFSISSFVLSLVVISIGTNIPELSLVIRSVMQKKQEIALADYLGSASVNTLLFGVLTIIYGRTISVPNHILQRFILLALGLVMFYFFARTRNAVSRTESILLLMIYSLFVWLELSIIS